MEVMYMAAETDKKTTLNLSMSPDDKKYLKTYAIEHDTTVARLIADYISNLRDNEARRKE